MIELLKLMKGLDEHPLNVEMDLDEFFQALVAAAALVPDLALLGPLTVGVTVMQQFES